MHHILAMFRSHVYSGGGSGTNFEQLHRDPIPSVWLTLCRFWVESDSFQGFSSLRKARMIKNDEFSHWVCNTNEAQFVQCSTVNNNFLRPMFWSHKIS